MNVYEFTTTGTRRASLPPAQRILIALHDLSGGGTERAAVRLANEWVRQGRTVGMFCGTADGPVAPLVSADVDLRQARPAIPRSLLSRWRLGHALAEAAESFGPDVVFAPGNFHLPVLRSFRHYDRRETTTLCKISDPLLPRSVSRLPQRVRSSLTHFIRVCADHFVAMSPALAPEIAQIVGSRRVDTLWQPIFDAPDLSISGKVPPRDPALVVAAGRLERRRGFDILIQAMAHLARWSDARLMILGEGSQRGRLQRQIEDLGLQQRVILLGHVHDVGSWLMRASCFVVPSRFAGYPAVLVEAAACGAPIVATACSPALDEMLSQVAIAMVVQKPDAEVLACAIGTMLQRRRRQWATPELLARHQVEAAATAYLEVMDRVQLERTRRSSRNRERAST